MQIPKLAKIFSNFMAIKQKPGKFLSVCGMFLMVSGVAGCGFRPLYGNHSQVQSQLAGIDVALIPDRTGQLLRQELQRRLLGSVAGPVQYTLNVSLSLHTDIAGILASNSVATRQRLSADAQWTLHDASNPQKIIAHGTANAADAENILNQQYFAADIETDAVNGRLMELLADQITGQLAADLDKK